MKIDKYFKVQKDFQRKLYTLEKMNMDEKIKLSKDYILCAHQELSEVLDCFKWKSHRKEDKHFSKSNLVEEIIDVFKYIITICYIWDISPKEFDKFFDDKTAVVLQRHRQEFMTAKKNEKVCAIDLDDVLCEWEKHFVEIFNKKYKENLSTDSQIRDHLGPLEYADFKHQFRESGEKRNIPIKKGARQLSEYLKKKGYRIIIISSRPYKDYFRIFSDTIYWLKKNRIKYNDLYFEENKHIKILKRFPNLKFMIEDNQKYAEQVADSGYKVFFLNKEYLTIDIYSKNIIRIDTLKEIKKYV